ncbi:MAG: HDOD domain-containing protein [Verrucomicrobiota bacterium]
MSYSIPSLIAGVPASLGAYAPVIEEIEAALQSPDCNLVTVAEAIEKEPDLTARLLRLGNSPLYGFSTRLTTINEAISLIGIRQAQELIQASSIIEQFAGMSSELVNMESFWRHSLACGVGARLLAMEKRLPKPDKFFVAGLLHDVGRLVLFSQAPAAAQQIFEVYTKEHLLLREAEVRVLGFDHQQIGEALLKYWRYPPLLVQAVGCHHQPGASDTPSIEATIVHVADHLANAMELGSSGERHVPPLQMKAWNSLRLSTNCIATVITDIDQQIGAVQEAFLKRDQQAVPA